MRVRAAVAVWLFVASAGLAAAQPGALDRAEQDRRTARVVYECSLLGSELYNRGNHEGCFRLYQGTLMAVQPLLDHRPQLASFVKDRLDKAATLRPADGAFALREALDAVQKETAEALGGAKVDGKDMPPPKKAAAAGLWDRLGGEKGVRPLVKDFLTAVAADQRIGFIKSGKLKLTDQSKTQLEQTLVEVLSEFTGGPVKYKGSDSTLVNLVPMAKEDFNLLTVHVFETLKKHKVPQNEMLDAIELFGSTRALVVGK
jgi:truncated hemoglobin YjbI